MAIRVAAGNGSGKRLRDYLRGRWAQVRGDAPSPKFFPSRVYMSALNAIASHSSTDIGNAGPVYVTLEFLAKRWGVTVHTIRRCAKSDPAYPQVHRFSARCSRILLADIEAYEKSFSHTGQSDRQI